MASVLELNRPVKQKKQPDAGTVKWFQDCVERGRNGPFAEVITITPGLAEVMLSNNESNRNLRLAKLAQFTSDMLGGRWVFNGESVLVADTGELNDGQHRLAAIVEAGTPQTFLVAFGVKRDTRTTVDQGSARAAGDYLQMQGVAHAPALAGVTRLVMAYEAGRGRHINAASVITNAQVVARANNDPLLHEAAAFAHCGARFVKGFLIPSIIGACYYLLSGEHPADAKVFMEQVVYGEDIRRGDPAFAVRNSLQNIDGPNKAGRMEIVFRGWNAFRQNRPLTLAKNLGTFPALV